MPEKLPKDDGSHHDTEVECQVADEGREGDEVTGDVEVSTGGRECLQLGIGSHYKLKMD
jgi:hypothetical protein